MINNYEDYTVCKCSSDMLERLVKQLEISAMLEGINDVAKNEITGAMVSALSLKDGAITILLDDDLKDTIIICQSDYIEKSYDKETFMMEFEDMVLENIVNRRETMKVLLEARKLRGRSDL